MDPTAIDRCPCPDQAWLLYAKSLADFAPERAIAAYHQAIAINPSIQRLIEAGWKLKELIDQE